MTQLQLVSPAAELKAADREAVTAIFAAYPYNVYQEQFLLAAEKASENFAARKKTLANFHSTRFLTTPLAFVHAHSALANTANNNDNDSASALAGISAVQAFKLLTQLLGRQTFILRDFFIATAAASTAAYAALWQRLLEALQAAGQVPDFMLTRLPAANHAAINALLQNGFYYVATESHYMLKLSHADNLPQALNAKMVQLTQLAKAVPALRFRLATKADLPALLALSAQTSYPSRYVMDPRFSQQQVKAIYQATLKISMQLNHHFICVCEQLAGTQRKLLGFISFIKNQALSTSLKQGYGSLDYIAVAPAARKQGIAALLNAWAIQFLACANITVIQVKTLAQNYPAASLLASSQFTLTASHVLLHYGDD